MSNYLVVSTSGNPDSNSRRMGQAAFDWLKKANLSCEWMYISKLNLPLCDADACYNDPAAQNLTTAIEKSGSAWEDKVVAFLCAAGGMSSYMSVMSFANSLMLDFRCLIIPRFVYATGHSFDGDRLTDDKLAKRIERVAADLVRVTKAVRDQ